MNSGSRIEPPDSHFCALQTPHCQRGPHSQKPRALRVQRHEQALCLFEIRCVKALGKPHIDRREKIAGLAAPALIVPETGKARSSAQFPGFCLVLMG